MERKNRYISLE